MAGTSFTSHLDGMALRGDTVAGGGGYVEATARGMGFPEGKTEGAKGAEPSAEKRKRKPRKAKEEGGAILRLAEIETGPPGDPSLKAPHVHDAPSSRKMNTQQGRCAGGDARRTARGPREDDEQAQGADERRSWGSTR